MVRKDGYFYNFCVLVMTLELLQYGFDSAQISGLHLWKIRLEPESAQYLNHKLNLHKLSNAAVALSWLMSSASG